MIVARAFQTPPRGSVGASEGGPLLIEDSEGAGLEVFMTGDADLTDVVIRRTNQTDSGQRGQAVLVRGEGELTLDRAWLSENRISAIDVFTSTAAIGVSNLVIDETTSGSANAGAIRAYDRGNRSQLSESCCTTITAQESWFRTTSPDLSCAMFAWSEAPNPRNTYRGLAVEGGAMLIASHVSIVNIDIGAAAIGNATSMTLTS